MSQRQTWTPSSASLIPRTPRSGICARPQRRGDGKDPKKLGDDLKTLQTKYDTDTANIKRDAAIDLALVKAHARDPQLTRAALKMDEIKVDKEGAVTGLDAQIEGLKKDKTWLFEDDGSAGNNGKGAAGGNKPAAGGSAYTPGRRRKTQHRGRSGQCDRGALQC